MSAVETGKLSPRFENAVKSRNQVNIIKEDFI